MSEQILKEILGELKSLNQRVANLEDGQKEIKSDVSDLKEGLKPAWKMKPLTKSAPYLTASAYEETRSKGSSYILMKDLTVLKLIPVILSPGSQSLKKWQNNQLIFAGLARFFISQHFYKLFFTAQ